jgi:hypothetical protein
MVVSGQGFWAILCKLLRNTCHPFVVIFFLSRYSKRQHVKNQQFCPNAFSEPFSAFQFDICIQPQIKIVAAAAKK